MKNRFWTRPQRSARGQLALALLLSVSLLPGCVYVSGKGLLDLGTGPLEEVTVSGEGRDRILLLEISGVISEQEGGRLLSLRREPSTLGSIKEQLEMAARDDRVKGLLLLINSPGGTVAASDAIYQEIKDFKGREGLSVAAYFLGTAASGGYYVALAADRIVTSPTAVIGSIGVIMLNLNFSGLMDKIGVSDTSVKSGEFKDMGSPFRKPAEGDRRLLQEITDGMHGRFCRVLEENRPGVGVREHPEIADGRVFTAEQALAKGLVDEIGYLPEAVSWVRKTGGLAKARLIRYARGGGHVPGIYALADGKGAGGVEVNLLKMDLQALLPGNGPVFMYLWAPEL